MKNQQSLWLGIGIGFVGAMLVFSTRSAVGQNKEEPMVYELRTYTAAEGKMDDLHKRFRDHTMKLFEKHGMKNVGYWTPVDKPNTLVYIVAHKNSDAAKKSWQGFRNDPDWQMAFRESQKDGSLTAKVESQYMAPTDYSPMK